MRDLFLRSLVLLFAAVTIAAIHVNTDNSKAMNLNTEENPLLANWEGPYGGVPPFDRVQIPLFKPALEAGMAEQLSEIQRIAAVLGVDANDLDAVKKALDDLLGQPAAEDEAASRQLTASQKRACLALGCRPSVFLAMKGRAR